MAPGLIVQTPVEGSPLRTTVPVDDTQEAGWVIETTTGAAGADGGASITTAADS
jgi:hypothetical protein